VGSTRAVGNVGSASSDSSDVGRVDGRGRPASCDDVLSWDRSSGVGLVVTAGRLAGLLRVGRLRGLARSAGLGRRRLLLGNWADGGRDGDSLSGNMRSRCLAVRVLRAAGSHSSNTGSVNSRGRPGGGLGWLSRLRLSRLRLGWLRLSRLGLSLVLFSDRADGSGNSNSLSGDVRSRCLAVGELRTTGSDSANAGGIDGGGGPSSSLGWLSRLGFRGLGLSWLGLRGLRLSLMLLSNRANSGRDSNSLSSDMRCRLLAVRELRCTRGNSSDGSRVDS
jgi:hypothetical protein